MLLICAVCVAAVGFETYRRLAVPAVSVFEPRAFENAGGLSLFEDAPAEPSPPENTSAPKEEASQQPSSAVEAAADQTVKGRVISRYISPYTAPLSYDNVYVKNSTDLTIDIRTLLKKPLCFSIKKSAEPEILILHTHTTETYLTQDGDTYPESYTSRTRDKKKNMVRIGDCVTEKLTAAGYSVIHETTEHDYPQYNGSYTRAASTISKTLKKYPSIKIILDLHRDAITSGDSDKVKTVTEIEGKKAAQVMLVMGSQSGGVTNFPDWQENFKLALRLQQTLERMYPTLARPVSLTSKNYNESLSKGSLLIEFGTDANTLSEACYSAELVGNALVNLLDSLK